MYTFHWRSGSGSWSTIGLQTTSISSRVAPRLVCSSWRCPWITRLAPSERSVAAASAVHASSPFSWLSCLLSCGYHWYASWEQSSSTLSRELHLRADGSSSRSTLFSRWLGQEEAFYSSRDMTTTLWSKTIGRTVGISPPFPSLCACCPASSSPVSPALSRSSCFRRRAAKTDSQLGST